MSDFEKNMNDYFDKKRKEMKELYNRVLPSGELIFNRFEKAEFLGGGGVLFMIHLL